MQFHRVFSFKDYLLCTIINRDEKIELYYDDWFIYDPDEKSLSFSYIDDTYKIHPNGVSVQTPLMTLDLKANMNSENGSIDDVIKVLPAVHNVNTHQY